jgi:hypothetical protein
MKRILLASITAFTFFLTGCLENTQEVTINEDGSGTLKTTSDMSGLIGIAKQFAGDKMDEIPQDKIDTTIELALGADSIPSLTDAEKEILKTGSMRMNMDMGNDVMIFGFDFPFNSVAQINDINAVSSKAITDIISSKVGDAGIGGDTGLPKGSSIDDYYTVTYSKGMIEKKLNKDKYAGVDSDEFLSGMKQMTAMGLNMKNTFIINLPKPATKTEGKGLIISDDKRKITIEASIDDFFDDPSKLEFTIEY